MTGFLRANDGIFAFQPWFYTAYRISLAAALATP
jgi:hypothetical protein